MEINTSPIPIFVRVPTLLEQDFGFPTNLVVIGEGLDKKQLAEGLEKVELNSI